MNASVHTGSEGELDFLYTPAFLGESMQGIVSNIQHRPHSGLEALSPPVSLGASSRLQGRCDILSTVEVKYLFPLTFCLLVVAVPEQLIDLSPLLS